MAFRVRMGVPDMAALWSDLSERKLQNSLDADEERFFKKLLKVLRFLQENPLHNSLRSHEIESLSRRYGRKVFQSYLENNTPGAGRIFWVYGPDKLDITIIG